MQDDVDACEIEPTRLRKIAIVIWEELDSIQKEWDLFQALFMYSQDRLDVLCEYLSTSIRTIDKALQRDIILRVARLDDPATQSNHKNISFSVFQNISADNTPVSRIFADWRTRTHRDLVVAMRNREVAHIDECVRFGDVDRIKVEFQLIGNAIEHMKRTLLLLSEHYTWRLWEWDERAVAGEIDGLLERMNEC